MEVSRSDELWAKRGKFYNQVGMETMVSRQGICAPQLSTNDTSGRTGPITRVVRVEMLLVGNLNAYLENRGIN